MMKRKHPINNEYWSASGGVVFTSTTPNGYSDSQYRLTVASQNSIPADVRWFPRGLLVYVNGVTSGGTTTHTQFKIVDSAVSGDSVVLYLISQNSVVIGPSLKHQVPVTGLLVRGAPIVYDPQSYCAEIPGLNTNQLTPFWWKSTRHSFCEDDLTLKVLGALRQQNPLFREFGDPDTMELNKQIVEDYQRRIAWDFWFAKPLANQTLADYESLNPILIASGDASSNTYWGAGKFWGREANAIGIYWQLMECGRVKDLLGLPLNLPELFRALYTMQRVRENNGIESKVFELWMPSDYRPQFAQAMLRYFKAKSEGMLQLNYELSSKVHQGPFGFAFQDFALDYPDVTLRLVSHKFFDDYLSAHTSASSTLTNSGRQIWIIDPSTNYKANIGSNSVVLNSGDIKRLAEVDDSFMCVMDVPRKRQRLVSESFMPVSECPQSSLIIEGISNDIPEHQYTVNNPDDLYGDYTGNN